MKLFITITTYFTSLVLLPTWVMWPIMNAYIIWIVIIIPIALSHSQLLLIKAGGKEYAEKVKLSHIHPLSMYWFLVTTAILLCTGWFLYVGETDVVIAEIKRVIPFAGVTLFTWFVEAFGWLEKFIFWISEDL